QAGRFCWLFESALFESILSIFCEDNHSVTFRGSLVYILGGIVAADERLLVEAAQSDPARFADLYEAHFETVYAFIVRRVRDRDTAEDLTSEVFHKALANLREYEWRGY